MFWVFINFLLVLLVLPYNVTPEELPTLYEYYVDGPIESGLSTDQPYFTLNGKNITIYSGAMHYFRVPRQYWRDRLRKMRAVGLNAVETYVPWNLHEFKQDQFDFGDGGSDWQDFLDIKEFFHIVQEEDLFAIVRPGPYICAEWEFGGFPSWLLREKEMKFRQSDPIYMEYVTKYFNELLPRLAVHQFTNGGPIIAFQVENEYGSTLSDNFTPDLVYLEQLRQLMSDNGIKELLFTSDSATGSGTIGTLPGVFLMTANLGSNPQQELDKLQEFQPNKPSMVMEYYPGWFDHWGEEHHTKSVDEVESTLEAILKYPASFNIYMFHGGTSFGFMNGANLNNGNPDNSGYQPDTNSYDYDAPLTENGNYTEKYFMIKNLLEKYTDVKTKLPEVPEFVPPIAFPKLTVQLQLTQEDALYQGNLNYVYENPQPMELLEYGQSFGYILYRKYLLDLKPGSTVQIMGYVRDTVTVFVNDKLISSPLNSTSNLDGEGFWRVENQTIVISDSYLTDATVSLLVENWGRVGFGHLDQFKVQLKGIDQGPILIDGEIVPDWAIISLDFQKKYCSTVTGFQEITYTTGPGLYKSTFVVEGEPRDTYVDMSDWVKGIVVVNNFVLGRYSVIGPQQSLYLPGPFLQTGVNTILIFEHYQASDEIKFSDHPIFLTRE